MPLIVPLQEVVNGRGGLVLGSLIPCGLFYFLQLYLKRHRSPSPFSPSAASLQSTHGILDPAPFATRARSIAMPSDSPYYVGLESSSKDPYDALENPDGMMQLGLAENRMSLDLIEKWLCENWNLVENGNLGISGVAQYQPLDGLIDLKVAVAGFMTRVMGVTIPFDPSKLVLTSGATPAIEILSFCLADPGDAFLIPTPYYPGFDRDIKWRTNVDLVPIICRSSNNFSLTISAINEAFDLAKKQGLKVRGILISNPSNPVGNILPRETLKDILTFAREKNIHTISDEIFAGSTFKMKKFTSMAEIASPSLSSRVHIIYGLSKDFSIPGFRIGAIYSSNTLVLSAAKKLARFCSVSVPTQRLVTSMLSDNGFVEHYVKENRARIWKRYDIFVKGLRELGFGCVASDGGLCCWVDMRDLVRRERGGEIEVWKKMMNGGKVNITPGSACHCIEAGWFRCCFSALKEEDIPVFLGRLRKALLP